MGSEDIAEALGSYIVAGAPGFRRRRGAFMTLYIFSSITGRLTPLALPIPLGNTTHKGQYVSLIQCRRLGKESPSKHVTVRFVFQYVYKLVKL
jgi:hypothetical protein